MKILKVALGLLAAAAVVPYRVEVSKENEEDVASKVTVKSLLYTVEAEPKRDENGAVINDHDVSIVIPSDAFKKVVSVVSEKVSGLVQMVKTTIASATEGEGEEVPAEEITVEVPAEEIAE